MSEEKRKGQTDRADHKFDFPNFIVCLYFFTVVFSLRYATFQKRERKQHLVIHFSRSQAVSFCIPPHNIGLTRTVYRA